MPDGQWVAFEPGYGGAVHDCSGIRPIQQPATRVPVATKSRSGELRPPRLPVGPTPQSIAIQLMLLAITGVGLTMFGCFQMMDGRRQGVMLLVSGVALIWGALKRLQGRV